MFSISTDVVCLQHCLVFKWLVPCEAAAVLVHSVYTIQPCTMVDHSMQYCGDMGMWQLLKWVSTESWQWRIKFSCQYSNSWPFSHDSDTQTTWLSLLSVCVTSAKVFKKKKKKNVWDNSFWIHVKHAKQWTDQPQLGRLKVTHADFIPACVCERERERENIKSSTISC